LKRELKKTPEKKTSGKDYQTKKKAGSKKRKIPETDFAPA